MSKSHHKWTATILVEACSKSQLEKLTKNEKIVSIKKEY